MRGEGGGGVGCRMREDGDAPWKKLKLNPKPVQRPFDPLKGLDYTKHANNFRNSLRGKSWGDSGAQGRENEPRALAVRTPPPLLF